MKKKSTKELIMENGPRYEHDCDFCKFMGQYKEYDLYICPEDVLKLKEYIARYSSNGCDYYSYPENLILNMVNPPEWLRDLKVREFLDKQLCENDPKEDDLVFHVSDTWCIKILDGDYIQVINKDLNRSYKIAGGDFESILSGLSGVENDGN